MAVLRRRRFSSRPEQSCFDNPRAVPFRHQWKHVRGEQRPVALLVITDHGEIAQTKYLAKKIRRCVLKNVDPPGVAYTHELHSASSDAPSFRSEWCDKVRRKMQIDITPIMDAVDAGRSLDAVSRQTTMPVAVEVDGLRSISALIRQIGSAQAFVKGNLSSQALPSQKCMSIALLLKDCGGLQVATNITRMMRLLLRKLPGTVVQELLFDKYGPQSHLTALRIGKSSLPSKHEAKDLGITAEAWSPQGSKNCMWWDVGLLLFHEVWRCSALILLEAPHHHKPGKYPAATVGHCSFREFSRRRKRSTVCTAPQGWATVDASGAHFNCKYHSKLVGCSRRKSLNGLGDYILFTTDLQIAASCRMMPSFASSRRRSPEAFTHSPQVRPGEVCVPPRLCRRRQQQLQPLSTVQSWGFRLCNRPTLPQCNAGELGSVLSSTDALIHGAMPGIWALQTALRKSGTLHVPGIHLRAQGSGFAHPDWRRAGRGGYK